MSYADYTVLDISTQLTRKLYTFAIDPELAEALKDVKARDGIGESEQIRRALRAWFKKKGVMNKSERKRVVARRRA